MSEYVLRLEQNIARVYNFETPRKDENIIVAVARDETRYIKEWVEHYLYLGFDRIFIGDNNNVDDHSMDEALKEYIQKGRVVLLDCRGIVVPFQAEFYNMFSMKGEYNWAFFCDIDEFLELNAFSNIKDFLETKKEEDTIFFKWVSYGNNGIEKYEDKPVQERFKYPLPLMIPDNFRFKSMIRGGKSIIYEIHGPRYYEYDKCHMTYRDGYLKHYKFKSIEEQLTKDKKLAYTTVNVRRHPVVDNSTNVYYHNDLLNKYYDLRGEHKQACSRTTEKNGIYNVLVYKYYSDIVSKKPYFTKLFPLFSTICNDMALLRDKYFLVDFDCTEEEFNVMFEMALHTRNKVCMTMPKIKDQTVVSTIYL